jgi:hypothetical protein
MSAVLVPESRMRAPSSSEAPALVTSKPMPSSGSVLVSLLSDMASMRRPDQLSPSGMSSTGLPSVRYLGSLIETISPPRELSVIS